MKIKCLPTIFRKVHFLSGSVILLAVVQGLLQKLVYELLLIRV